MNHVVCDKVIDVTAEHIELASKKQIISISFKDCVKNYAIENGNNINKCIATRDITTLSFVFFTQPKTKVIFKKNFLGNLLPSISGAAKFSALQKAIFEAGYTSYDLS